MRHSTATTPAIENCGFLFLWFYLVEAHEKIVFVGSLADVTSDMADYSVVADDLKNDFLL